MKRDYLYYTCGIYKIWFEGAEPNPDGNPKLYIGLGKNIGRRRNNHLLELRRGVHWNSYLQNYYNKYGEKSLRIDVVEECSFEQLPEKEVYWIEQLKTTIRNYGFNLTKGGDRPEFTEEHRLNISNSAKKRGMSLKVIQAAKAFNTGRKQSQSEKDKRALALVGGRRTEGQKMNMRIAQKKRDYHPSQKTKEVLRVKATEQNRRNRYAIFYNCQIDELPKLPPPPPYIELEKKSGIYKVEFVGTNLIYIGKAKEMKEARRILLLNLAKKCYKHKPLQEAYNQYEEHNLIFSVIEYCDKTLLAQKKINYINDIEKENNYRLLHIPHVGKIKYPNYN